MPNIINMRINYVCLFQKKKDVSIHFAIHGERLFPCHFISTLSCASAVIKRLFFKFALTALRFLKNSNLGAILLNTLNHFHKTTRHQLSINGESKNLITLSEVLPLFVMSFLTHFLLYHTFLKNAISYTAKKSILFIGYSLSAVELSILIILPLENLI